MSSEAAAHVVVHGRVQGVGFRFFAQETAERLGLCGWVKNLPNGDVEALAEGSRPLIDEWIFLLKKGPLMARVEQIQVDWQRPRGEHRTFSISS